MVDLKKKLWFSFFDRGEYRGDEPAFFDVKELRWAQTILNNKEVILNEFKTVTNDSYSPYFNQSVVNKKHVWKTISFKFWTVNYYKNQQLYPQINKVLNQIPGLLTVSINKLEAGGRVFFHNGDSNGFYRCHFGLDIPDGLPNVGFKVLDETIAWKEGELLVFCDANRHEAWNSSDKDRYILVFDVVRPEFEQQKSKIIHTVSASIFLQSLAERMPFIHKFPAIIMNGLHFFAKMCSMFYIPIRNQVAKLFS